MKPFISIQNDKCFEDNQPITKSEKRSRSKSPKMNRGVFHEKLVNKGDFKALRVEGDHIVLDEDVEDLDKALFSSFKQTSFPNLIDEHDSNRNIYKASLEPRLDSIFEGKSFTILTYGISGSGKSHTIFGTKTEQFKENGILFHFIEAMMKRKDTWEMQNNVPVSITLSFIEIYNEQVRDLLSEDSTKRLTIVESPFTNGVMVPEMIKKPIQSLSQLNEDLTSSLSKRIVCPNMNNNYSSRSHVIVEIVVQSQSTDRTSKQFSSKVRFVDLAGSEKVTRN